jgi:predicted SPOUT superfamily RNA methylase MTH1
LASVKAENGLQQRKLSIAIPASVVSDIPHLREKTSKIGVIGRVAAIFRVDEIIVYPDNPQIRQISDTDLISSLLTYMETPQYLRRRLFRLRPELQFAGILAPLRTPHHPLDRRMKDLKEGEYREGVTLSRTKEGMLTDIGVEQPALLLNKQLPVDKRVTVKITRIDERVEVELANRDEIPEYWGYLVTMEKQPLGRILKSRNVDLVIATSKSGVPFTDVAEKMTERWEKAETVLVAFGAPSQGLCEIVKREGLNLDDIADFVINTIPAQGTETVRTEEALIASLAILNLHFQF